jgi:hypothetical protein
MRLKKIERGEKLTHKLIYGVVRVASGFRAPDVVRTILYRQPWFGAHMGAMTQAVMRGPSEWSVGERELFAAFVSRMNQCPF